LITYLILNFVEKEMENTTENRYSDYKRKVLTDDHTPENTNADSQDWLDDYTARITVL